MTSKNEEATTKVTEETAEEDLPLNQGPTLMLLLTNKLKVQEEKAEVKLRLETKVTEETAEEDLPNKLKVQEGKAEEVDFPRPWQGSSTLGSATSSSVLSWRSSFMNSTPRENEIHRSISSRHMSPFDPQLRFLLCKQ